MSELAQLLPAILQQFLDDNGVPLAGGTVNTYEAGTTTPLATYTDATALAENTNPIVLDSTGRANIYLGTSAYKFVIADVLGNPIATIDNISYINPGSIITAMIADDAITSDLIADGAVGTDELADGAVTTVKIIDKAVTGAKIALETVTAANILDATITNEEIALDTILGANIADGTIPFSKMSPFSKVMSATAISSSVSGVVSQLTTSIVTTGRNVRIILENGEIQDENFANSQWKMWLITASTTDVTTAIQAGTAQIILPTTNGYGVLFQSRMPFSQIIMTVSTSATGGTFTYQYWNGSSWQTLSRTTTPTFSSTGSTTLAFDIPTNWAPGDGVVGGAAGLYSIQIFTASGASGPISINALSIINNDTTLVSAIILSGASGATSVSLLSVQLGVNIQIQRSLSSGFAGTPAIVGNTTYILNTLSYDTIPAILQIPPSAFSFYDDDGGAGLAANTYYYRVSLAPAGGPGNVIHIAKRSHEPSGGVLMTAKLIPPLIQKFTDDNGDPLAGGFVFTYIAGSTTPAETYTDQSGDTPNTNPIILDSTGACEIWIIDGFFKFSVYDADMNLQFVTDNVAPAIDADAEAAAADYAAAAAASAASVAGFFPAGSIGDTPFTIVNNQGSAANITGLIFNLATNLGAVINYVVQRITTSTGATTIMAAGVFNVVYDSVNGWRIVQGNEGPDLSGLIFSITSLGQVQYTSSNITGTASVSKMHFNALAWGL